MAEYSNFTVKEKKEFWKDNPLNGNVQIKIDNINDFVMHCKNDDTVVKELYWTNFKGWELTSLNLWNSLLNFHEEGVVYDIGSYSGIYSIIASRVSNKFNIYAFDIQDNCLERLEKNIQINHLNNIEVTKAACTEFNGETTFYYYKEKDIMSSVASLKPNKMNNLEDKVVTIKLDDFNKKVSLEDEVKLIKIDVEGAEKGTLKGLQQVLKKFSPDVLIEVNNYNELKEVNKLFPSGYNVYDINEDNMSIKKLGFFVKPSKHRNYFFTVLSKNQVKDIFNGEVK